MTAALGEALAPEIVLLRQGELERRQGRALAALELVRKAIEIDPDNSDAQNELGDIYRSLGSSRSAVEAYRRALELRPDHPEATRNLATVLDKLKPLEESAAAHRCAIEQEPGNTERLYALAAVCRDLGDIGAAIEALKKALAIRPEAHAFRRLGAILCAIGRFDEAAAAYEAWLRAEPASPLARHMLAACSGKDVPQRAADAFVAAEFDRFADTFDQVLDQLEYRAPALVAKALQRIAGEPRGELDIVDAGCGTGQLAQYLRPYARRLVGVDLSPKMLEKAARRALYDETSLAELTAFLRASPGAFDLVAASDTLNYFGDLRDALAAARASLRPGGLLVFTLEHSIDVEALAEGYRIHPHGRYSHAEAYVRRTLALAGLSLVDIEKAQLRREGDAYVDGLVVCARCQEQDAQSEEVARAIALHRGGQLGEAEAIYLAVLEADADNADALHYLGVLRHQQGRSILAVDLVCRAIEARPGYVDALNNLGNIYQQLDSPADADNAYQAALELQPDHQDALRNRAKALRRLEHLEQCADAYRRAIEEQPLNIEHYYRLAAAYDGMQRLDDAVQTLRKAMALKPEPEGFRRLGQILHWLRRTDEAADNYRAWLRIEPDNPVARHMLAACTLKDVPPRAEDAFVTRVFDGLAESFDEALHRIEYCAPALLGEALQRSAGAPRGELEIMDAGCGTGLLAQHLRPYAKRLVGVDLSPKMLQQARKRGLYDEAVVAELASFLSASSEAFDVVASSDTLVYFGELRGVLAAARRSLRQGGILLFTLEQAIDEDEARPGYRLNPAGRYMHSEPYVRRSLGEAGFELIGIEKAHLRREGEACVAGLVVAARARAAASENS